MTSGIYNRKLSRYDYIFKYCVEYTPGNDSILINKSSLNDLTVYLQINEDDDYIELGRVSKEPKDIKVWMNKKLENRIKTETDAVERAYKHIMYSEFYLRMYENYKKLLESNK
jgi:hypothetical protein